jgi:divalent metal cation (Fe/Co/Zn/Cd) transporter
LLIQKEKCAIDICRPKSESELSGLQISKVVQVAIAANAGIAISKYIAALISRSPAMLAEALHSMSEIL